MRLHSLTITAFGPYAGTETVDFEALSGAGLFLINGPTGAGKTSVLDAVCFALYGRVPSVRNDAKDLRSQHQFEVARTALADTVRDGIARTTAIPHDRS